MKENADTFLLSHCRLIKIILVSLILVLCFWSGIKPHLTSPYPLHVDEWFAIGYSESTINYESLEYPNMYFYGVETIKFHPQMGFHLVLGFVRLITGLPILTIYPIIPGIIFAILAFFTYSLNTKSIAGIVAAAFIPLIPTSILTLGPTFLVPISLSLLFIPITLLVINRINSSESASVDLWVVFIVLAGTIFIHPTTEGVITLLVGIHFLILLIELVLNRKYKQSLKLLFALSIRMIIPIIILVIWIPSFGRQALQESLTNSTESISALGYVYGFFEAFGLVPSVLFAFGIFIYSWKQKIWSRSYALPIFTTILIVYLNIVYPNYAIGPSAIYYRGWLHLGLFMAIFIGYCIDYYYNKIIQLLIKIKLRSFQISYTYVVISVTLVFVVIIGSVLYSSLESDNRVKYARYYSMMNEQIYSDFRWIGENTDEDQTVAVMEPSLAWSYPPIAGKGHPVFGVTSAPWSSPWVEEVRTFLDTGNVSINWFIQREINIIYTKLPGNPVYTKLNDIRINEIRPGVFFISPYAFDDNDLLITE